MTMMNNVNYAEQIQDNSKHFALVRLSICYVSEVLELVPLRYYVGGAGI